MSPALIADLRALDKMQALGQLWTLTYQNVQLVLEGQQKQTQFQHHCTTQFHLTEEARLPLPKLGAPAQPLDTL